METAVKPRIKQGWLRASIYLICFVIISAAGELTGSFAANSVITGTEEGDSFITHFIVSYTISGLLLVLITWLMTKFIDRRSFKSLGFEWDGYKNEAGIGFFAALAILGIGTIILVTIGYLSLTSAGFNVTALVIEAILMIEVAFVEELVVRGYILNNLMQSTNKWTALITSSALFAIFHFANPDVTALSLLNIFAAGLLLGLNYIFTKNLWYGIFFHFAWNFFQGPILGYDVSGLKLTSLLQQSMAGSELWTGGQFGFEGSLLCPVLLIIVTLVFTFLFMKRYEPISK